MNLSDEPVSDSEEIFEEAVEDLEEEYCQTLNSDTLQFAAEEIGETDSVREGCVRDMRRWVESQPHFNNCRTDANFLCRFLRTNKFKLEKSCQMLERYLKMRLAHPKWFQNLDIQDPMVQELIESGYIFVLPERDSQGRRVVFSVARVLDPSKHNTSHVVRAHIATFETLLQEEENQVRGFSYIFDCTGLTLAHLSIWTPQECAKILSICDKNLPMRHKDINLVNLPFPMWAVFEFCKTLLSDKIRRRFTVINSIEKLQAKMGTDILPFEYGGRDTVEDMTGRWIDVVRENRDVLLELDSITIHETALVKKTKDKKNSLWNIFSNYGSQASGESL